jgi:hypothetical protein
LKLTLRLDGFSFKASCLQYIDNHVGIVQALNDCLGIPTVPSNSPTEIEQKKQKKKINLRLWNWNIEQCGEEEDENLTISEVRFDVGDHGCRGPKSTRKVEVDPFRERLSNRKHCSFFAQNKQKQTFCCIFSFWLASCTALERSLKEKKK